MYGASATVLRARRFVLVAVRRCVGQVSLSGKMRDILGNLTHSGNEAPEEQSRDHDRAGTFHPAGI